MNLEKIAEAAFIDAIEKISSGLSQTKIVDAIRNRIFNSMSKYKKDINKVKPSELKDIISKEFRVGDKHGDYSHEHVSIVNKFHPK